MPGWITLERSAPRPNAAATCKAELDSMAAALGLKGAHIAWLSGFDDSKCKNKVTAAAADFSKRGEPRAACRRNTASSLWWR